MLFNFCYIWSFRMTICEKFYDKIFKFVGKLRSLLRCMTLTAGTPVFPEEVILLVNDILVQIISYRCLIFKWHSTSDHNEQNHPCGKNIYSSTSIRSLFQNFWSHIVSGSYLWVHYSQPIVALLVYWETKVSKFSINSFCLVGGFQFLNRDGLSPQYYVNIQ